MNSSQYDVVHICFRPPFTSGSFNRIVGDQLKLLKKHSHAVISFWDSPIPAGADTQSVFLVNGRDLSIRQRAFLRLPSRIRRNFNNGLYDRQVLVHMWQTIELLRRLRPKVIVCYDNYKLGRLLRQNIDWNTRLVLSQHGLSYHLDIQLSRKIYSLDSFDAVWLLSLASYLYDKETYQQYEPVVSILPNGVDTDRFQPVTPGEKVRLREKHGLPKDQPIILHTGRLVAKKGMHLIFYSWRKILEACPDAILWIVGSGEPDYLAYLKGLSKPFADSIRFHGFVNPDDIHECYRASDMFVFPTVWGEGFPLSMLEALASGLACVVSDFNIGLDVFTKEAVRFVDDPNVEDQFVEPLVELLREPEKRRALSENGRALIMEKYTLEHSMQLYERFYQRQVEIVDAMTP